MHLTLFTGGHAPGMVLLIGNVGAYCCADGNTCFYVVELNTIFNCFVSKGICVFHCVIGELEKVVILKPVDFYKRAKTALYCVLLLHSGFQI